MKEWLLVVRPYYAGRTRYYKVRCRYWPRRNDLFRLREYFDADVEVRKA